MSDLRADCVFCQIAAGLERSWTVYENADVIAILDRSPAVPGHTLVIPRRHAADIWDIRREDAARLMEAVHDVAALLQERLRPDGMTLFQANRPAGWQTVFHIHVHLVPRHDGDPLTVSWQPRPATEAALDEAHGRIRGLRRPADDADWWITAPRSSRRLVDRDGAMASGDRPEQQWLDGGHTQAES